nr:hypothetical protein BACY1_00430 [Tenacibaculum mesophilum]
MTIDEFIIDLRSKNIIISVQDNNVAVKDPDEVLTSDIIAAIREKKQEILSFYNNVKKENEFEYIKLAPKQEYYPVSFGQKRLWILDQLRESNGLYNVNLRISLRNMEIAIIQRTLVFLIERHEILRTTFKVIEGTPRQYIEKSKEFDLTIQYKKAQSEIEYEQLKEEELFYPFQLDKAAVKATIIEDEKGNSELFFVMHHIIVDGWSTEILKKEFAHVYESFAKGIHPNLKPLSIQYKDYAVWQNDLIESGTFKNAKTFWNQKFSSEIPRLNLPIDDIQSEKIIYKGTNAYFEIPQDITAELIQYANQQDASLFMVLLGMVKTLFHRYTGQEDIIIGSVVSGREHISLQEQIGFFVNTIALRTLVKGTDTFNKVLEKVKSTTLDAFEYQSYPFDMLVEEVNEKVEKNRNPIFDVLFNYAESVRDNQDNETSLSEGETTFEKTTASKFDLSFDFIKIKDGGIKGIIGYNTELFLKEKIMRMAKHLIGIARAVITNQEQPIFEFEYFQKEKKHIVSTFNSLEKELSSKKGIKHLFEDNAKKYSNELAILNTENSITYGELNKKANQFANYLIKKHAISKGDSIAILTRNATHRIIALLGIIKTGAAYVPLSEDFPEERKKYILNDAKAKLVVVDTSKELIQNISIANEVPFFNIEKSFEQLAQYNDENIDIQIGLEDVFTILYTSGSTGKPKGVLIKNVGLINRLQWFWKHYNFTKEDVIYQKTPYVFDVSIGEIFLGLCFGSKLVLANTENSLQTTENIQKYGVTYIHFSPTQLRNYLTAPGNDVSKINTLRMVVCSGEELSKEVVYLFYKHMQVPLSNLYGPTEASIEVTYHDMNIAHTKKKTSRIPIGKPIENVQIYILDHYNKIVPIGIVGEIGIAGKCLAKGYLNMPEKTDQQFIHCELNKGEEVRIYKTGDYGKWLGDGTIQYLGRIDNQTSINGYRIELEEIESFMCQYSKLQNAVVIPKQGEQGNWYLVAYYTLLKEKQSFGNEIITKTGIPSMVTNVSNYNITNVYEMLQKTFKEYSEKIALEYNETRISYGSLFDEVEKFSAYLLETYNVQVGDHVVLIGGRSERTIISLLAILKLGAVYVPVDNEYPKSRIDYIIQDSNPTLIIAEVTLSFRLEAFEIPLIYNDYRLYTKGYKPLKEEIKIQQDDLSYICYTSGSTGKPKGVMIPQKSVVDYIKTFTDYFKLVNTDVVIQQSSISFDTSIEEILPTLYSGAKLVILPDGGRNVEAIISTINNNGVSILSTTPLVINELNRYCNQLSRFPRAIISGGDTLGGSYIDQLLEETTIFNTYGPTEFTVCASFHQIVNKEDSNTIGHPIANHTIYLLDDEMNPVVDGAIGEMFIEGAGMAKGYLNNNKETAKYFVSNPFNEGLFYKTGDLAYRNDKQELIFCGRKDNQVKINGYRIELIEIDKALQELSGILNCISTAKSDTNNTKHLVTYYVGSNDISKETIRTFLMEKLPHYMVPDYIVQLEEIPQNSNGKIDVRALPAPESLLQDEAFVIELKKFLKRKMPAYMIPSHFVHLEAMPLTVSGKIDRKSLEKRAIQSHANNECLEPKNDTETQLRAIWQYCLDIPKIGTNINFFELGGNSIKATQIMSKIHEIFAQKIPLKSIYNNPTIVELANFIEGGQTKSTLLLHLNKFESNQPNIFCIPPILGSSTVFKNMAVALNKHANIYGLQYRGFDADEPFDKSINHMAASFIYEIQKVINNEQPVIIVGYSMGATIAFEIVKTLEATYPNIKLVLLDRGIQKEGESVLIASEINTLLEKELILWKKEMSTSDFERIKRLVIHNTKILAAHELQGNIKADILAIEAVNDLAEANMIEWGALSSGAFTHQYIKANHYEILETQSESIIKLLKQLIQENHDHGNHNQRKMTL